MSSATACVRFVETFRLGLFVGLVMASGAAADPTPPAPPAPVSTSKATVSRLCESVDGHGERKLVDAPSEVHRLWSKLVTSGQPTAKLQKLARGHGLAECRFVHAKEPKPDGPEPGDAITLGGWAGEASAGQADHLSGDAGRSSPAPPPRSPPEAVQARLLDKPLQRLESQLDYPPELRAAGVEGSVTLRVVVDTDGSVAHASFLVGDTQFREAALTSARKWRFSPPLVKGSPTRAAVTIRVVFRLE